MKKGILMVAFAALAVAAAPAMAQEDATCRCVDADGNEIERCRCFQMPDVDGLLARFEVDRTRPRLGITLDPGQGASRDAEGAVVRDVLEGGPADEAGLREGDVITRLNGVSLTEPMGAEAERRFDLDESIPVQRLMAAIRELEPGAEVEVEYLRDGRAQTTMIEAEDLSARWGRDVTVMAPGWDVEQLRDRVRSLGAPPAVEWHGAMPRDFEYRVHEAPGPEFRVFSPGAETVLYSGGLRRDGLELVELNPGLGAYFGADEGVLVANVDEDTPLGLRPGDVVTVIGGRAVTTPDRFRRILASYGSDEEIEFDVRRDGQRTSVTGRLRS